MAPGVVLWLDEQQEKVHRGGVVMWWYHGDWGWGAWLVMSLGMLAFWGLVLWAVINLARNTRDTTPPTEDTPEDILGERLARGDIDEDEYQRRLDALRTASAGASDRMGAP
jgi:putative membrane protein